MNPLREQVEFWAGRKETTVNDADEAVMGVGLVASVAIAVSLTVVGAFLYKVYNERAMTKVWEHQAQINEETLAQLYRIATALDSCAGPRDVAADPWLIKTVVEHAKARP